MKIDMLTLQFFLVLQAVAFVLYLAISATRTWWVRKKKGVAVLKDATLIVIDVHYHTVDKAEDGTAPGFRVEVDAGMGCDLHKATKFSFVSAMKMVNKATVDQGVVAKIVKF
jgi:hypothetical protein